MFSAALLASLVTVITASFNLMPEHYAAAFRRYNMIFESLSRRSSDRLASFVTSTVGPIVQVRHIHSCASDNGCWGFPFGKKPG